MKKLLLLFITLTTLSSVSYASFPITENTTVLTTSNFEIEDEEDDNEPSLIVYILRGILLAAILFFGIRAFIRAWRNRKWWARLLPWAILIAILINGLIAFSYYGSGMGG